MKSKRIKGFIGGALVSFIAISTAYESQEWTGRMTISYK